MSHNRGSTHALPHTEGPWRSVRRGVHSTGLFPRPRAASIDLHPHGPPGNSRFNQAPTERAGVPETARGRHAAMRRMLPSRQLRTIVEAKMAQRICSGEMALAASTGTRAV